MCIIAGLELVEKFCYLGDMLSIDWEADAAMEARVWKGWNRFRQLMPLLINKDVSREVIQKLCTELYIAFQWNLASEEREQVGTSASWDREWLDECELLK